MGSISIYVIEDFIDFVVWGENNFNLIDLERVYVG